MARPLWCQHVDCQRMYLSDAGYIPTLCPTCRRPARWNALAPLEQPAPPPLVWLPIDRLILLYLGLTP